MLRSHPPRRQITIERIEASTGRRWLERKTLAPVAGFDLVFSVPKSVSLLHALGDEETRLAIGQAHLAAWQAALGYLGATDVPVVSSALVDAVNELSAEQESMVRAVVTSPDRIVCVVGPAGAGKTSATHVVVEALRAAGAPVLGAAPSWIAAERLQDETGVPSRTLHRLLGDAKQNEGLPDRCVLIVDEAAMAETRVLAPILAAVEQAVGKAILIGDPRQLPAVGAGGLFAAIVERHGAIELNENQRQRDALERRALQAVREGLGRDYLAFADQRGRLVTIRSRAGYACSATGGSMPAPTSRATPCSPTAAPTSTS